MPPLDALLDGFADEQHPPEWKGKFRPGDKVRVAGKDGGVVGRVVRPADAKPHSHVVIAPKDGGAHIEAEVGKVKMDTPEQHAVHVERAERKAMAAAGPAKPVAVSVPGRAAAAAPAAKVSEGVLNPLLEGFAEDRHPRGFHGRWIATFAHPVHGRTTSPIEASSAAEAQKKAEAHARANGTTLQSVVKQGISDPKAARAAMHPTVMRALSGLGQGRWYSSPAGGGHVRRTAQGFEVYPHGSPQPAETHKQPSAAAGHLLRLGRVSPEHVDPSRHPPAVPGLPSDAAGLMRARGASGFQAGDHVIYEHGMFGKVPARVTKVTGGRVHITSSDARVSDTSMTHNQAAVRLEQMIGPDAPRVRLAKGQTANELRGGIRPARESAPVLGALLSERDFSVGRRQNLAKSGAAMKDGSYPIENAGDLRNAIKAVGRAKNPDAAKSHIRKRAAALKLTSLLPDGW